MLPVVEVPLIERVVGHLVDHGIGDVVLSLGYRPDAFVAGFPDGRCAGATLSYVVEAEPLDTAGAIRYAAVEAGIDETFLVVNGDVLSDLDVGALISFHRETGAEATIALTPVEDPSAFGVVPCDDDGRVTAFIEKPPAGTAPTNLINAGTYVLEPSVLGRIPGDRRVNVERETFPAMVADRRLYALAEPGYWLDVGTPERFLQAGADLLSGARPGIPAPGAVESAPGVWYVGAVKVKGVVVGPSLIGEGAVVEAGAHVSASVVGAGAGVARDALVAGSAVLAGARVGRGAVVRDSILGPHSVIGDGAEVIEHTVVGMEAHVEPGARLAGARHPA
jgi:NDP-sugar pyrophosphorylase family protein